MGLISRVSSRTYRFHQKIFTRKTQTMQLFINGTLEKYTISAVNEETLFDAIAEKEGDLNDLTYFCNGAPVDSFESLKEGSTIQINRKLLGGKVHGSLARAGKVKNNTPKVEAQEKKKPKTGRAKRRMQYNRRFNISAANKFGARRGPNNQEDQK